LEDVLQGFITKPQTVKSKVPQPASRIQTLVTSPREDYCLTLLLHFPELKTLDVGLIPEYFQDTENREIYSHWLETEDFMELKNRLDPVMREKMEGLAAKEILTDRIADKYAHCVLLLQKEYLQSQEAMRKEIFSQEAEAGGKGADLALLRQEGIESSIKLKKLFTDKAEITRRARK